MADIPGNVTTTATLPLGQAVTGRHEFDDDADWYRVQLRGGTNYTFQAFASNPSDGEYAFETVSLFDAQGRIIARSFSDDDDEYVGGFDYRPGAGGTFFLAVEGDEGDAHQIAFEVDEPAAPPSAAAISLGATREADFFSRNDRDTFSIRLEQGKVYDFPIGPEDIGGRVDVLDSRGRVLADGTDFRAPYTGTFHIRTDSFSGAPRDYTLAARVDRDAGTWDPAAPPTAGADLLIGSLVAVDRINALAGDDLVYGRGGNDDLQGGDGVDAVLGGDGNDRVYGGPGRDYLYGEAGDDKLGGGFGSDVMFGGAGRDVFDLQAASFERIGDFVRGQDRMDLSRIDANPAVAGDQAFAFIGTREPTGAGQVNYRYEAAEDATYLYGHTNADGPPSNFVILLDGKITLAASDLVL